MGTTFAAVTLVTTLALTAVVLAPGRKPVQAATPPGAVILGCAFSRTVNASLTVNNYVVIEYDGPVNLPAIPTNGTVSCSAALGQLFAAGYAVHHTSAGPFFVLMTPASLAAIGN